MLLFRAEEHIDRWCRARDLPRGATMTPEQCWRLASVWYGTRLQPDWRRFTLEESEGIFSEIGLTSPFWTLR
jgi:hypothetical protein